MVWSKNILTLSLLAAILCLPVSVMLCHLALGGYLIAWIGEGRWNQKWEIARHQPLIWGFLSFFALHLMGISYSEDVANGWFNVEKKLTFFLLPALMATTLSLDKKAVQFLFKGFIMTCVVTTLVCLWGAYGNYQNQTDQINFDSASLTLFQQLNVDAKSPWIFFSYIGLASSVGMHPTFLSLYLVFSILLLIHLSADSFVSYSLLAKTGIVLLFIYLESIMVLLSSRTLIIGFTFILIAGFFHLFGAMHLRPITRMLVIAGSLAPLVLILIANPVGRYRTFQEPGIFETYQATSDGVYTYSTGIRKSLWKAGLQAIGQVNPLFGAGTGDVKQAVKEASNLSGDSNILQSYDPHNQFIYTQIGLGFTGLASLLMCFYFPGWFAYRAKNYFYLVFLLLFTMVCSTESALESQKGIVFFSIFNSLLVFQYFNPVTIPLKKPGYG